MKVYLTIKLSISALLEENMHRSTSALATVLIMTLAVFSIASVNSPQQSFNVTVSEEGASSLRLNFDLGDYRFIETEKSGQVYHLIDYAGTGEILAAGRPEIPTVSKLVLIPANSSLRIAINNTETRSCDGIRLEEYIPEGPVSGRRGDSYDEFQPFPPEIVTVSEPVTAGGVTFCAVDIFPFRYMEAENRLEVIESIEFSLEFSRGTVTTASYNSQQRKFISSLGSHLIAPQQSQLDDAGFEPGEYLIVLPDMELEDIFTPFIEWKTQNGFNVTIADFEQIGTTAAELWMYLQDAYNTWENRPEYILLAGDIDGEIALPTFYYQTTETDSAPADHIYTLLEGEDYFSDVEIGRFPVQNEDELAAIINKTIRYESDPWLPSGYLHRGLMAADSSSKYSASVKEWAKELMLDFAYSEVETQYFFGNMNTTLLSLELNQGVGIFNFRGWSDWGGFTAGDVNALTNILEIPVVFGCAGGTNDFRLEESIGEAFVRLGSPDEVLGAAACVGPSDPNTYGKWDGTIDQGLMWGMFGEGMYLLSPILNRAKLELWLSFPWNRGPGYTYNSVKCYYNIYNIIGDPSLKIWRGQPEELTSVHPDSIPFGQNSFSATVTAGGQLVEDAEAVLSQGDEVIATAVSGMDGMVNFIIPEFTEGQVTLTVMGVDKVPFSSEIIIIETPAFIGFNDFEVDDDDTGYSSGNGDGNINPGEIVELTLSLFNYGTAPVESVSAIVSTYNPLVEILEPYAFFGNIGPWSLGVNDIPFLLTTDNQTRNGEQFVIGIEATGSAGENFTSAFETQVYTPEPAVEWFDFSSSPIDTVLSPGESSQLVIDVVNTGGLGWETLNCRVSVDFTGVSLDDSTSVFPACLPGETVNNDIDPLTLSIDALNYPGIMIPLTMFFETETGWLDTVEFSFLAGIPTVMDPVVPQDNYGYYCFDDGDVSYQQAPDFDWKEVDPDFGGGGILLDLNDTQVFGGDNAVIDLPPEFNFTYYGEEIEELTICSNGWLAAGVTTASDYLNKPITAAGNPAGMIAPFWDDLLLTDGGEVYYYYNPNEDWLVVEWSRVRNVFENETETFEVILYDADTYITPTGDSPVVFHYLSVHDVDELNDYSTVAILNNDASEGLQYVYSTQYSAGAAVLENQISLLFTTDPGSRVDPPELSYAPASFDFVVETGGIDSSYLEITNLGEADLEYDLSAGLWGQDNSGGPDQFGYIWVDSDEPWGNEFNWVDISTIGLEINFPHNDSTSADLPFGFSFPFYNQSFESIIVSANGWCSFTSHSSAWNNSSLPNNSAPENLVAGFWDDLDPLDGGNIYVWSNQTDSVIVSFIEVEHYGSTNGTYTYQVILEASGHITFQYRLMEGVVNSATVGIQNSDRTIGLQIIYNQNYLHDNMRIDIQKPWLSLSVLSGEVNGGETDSVTFIADGGYLPPGFYQTEVTMETNDPFQTEPVIIPVNLTVTGPANYVDNLTVSVSETGLTLNWTLNTDYNYYRVYRSEEPYFNIEDAVIIGETDTNYFLDETAFSGSRYFYRVTGF